MYDEKGPESNIFWFAAGFFLCFAICYVLGYSIG